MADIDSLADGRARVLARKIDAETVAHMGEAELRVRVETVAGLLDDFDRSDEYEKVRLRKEAERTLNAISLRAWIAGAKILSDDIDSAVKGGEGNAAEAAVAALDRFAKDNPQPGLSSPAVLAEMFGSGNAVEKPWRFKLWRRK